MPSNLTSTDAAKHPSMPVVARMVMALTALPIHLRATRATIRTKIAVTAIASSIALSGCSSRPTEGVLSPTVIAAPNPTVTEGVTLIAATNRAKSKSGLGYTREWEKGLHFERYRFSVPTNRDGTNISYPNSKPKPGRDYLVTGRENLTADDFVSKIVDDPAFDGTASVFVHGYNNSFEEALYRTAQMTADVDAARPPVLFAWPSAGSVMGYVADRDASLYSRSELTSVLEALGESVKIKRITLVAHSMGGFLSMESVRQLRLNGRAGTLGKLQIILASPDIDVDVFRSQITDIGDLSTPITLLVSKSDRALTVSSLLAMRRERVGKVDVHDPIIKEAAKSDRLRVVDISSLQSVDGLGHDRFASFARFAGTLAETEAQDRRILGNVGAFVFDTAGSAVTGPFQVAGEN